MQDHSYGQAYADWQAELRELAAGPGRVADDRDGPVRPGRIRPWRRAPRTGLVALLTARPRRRGALAVRI